ncbi:MAG: THUMP domain-containing protein [Promethearchaeota archaeon]
MNNDFKSNSAETSITNTISSIPLILKKFKNDFILILRYSEIALKSHQVKKKLIKQLVANIVIQFFNNGIKINRIWYEYGFIFIKPFSIPISSKMKKDSITNNKAQIIKDSDQNKNQIEQIAKIISQLQHVFGIYAINPAILINSNDPNIISENIIKFSKEILKPNQTFGVRVKRLGKQNYSSQELAAKLGADILNNLSNLNLKVDLTNPNHFIHVNVRDEKSYIYSDTIYTPWIGNPLYLPNGTIAIMMGYASDIISSFLIMKRGVFLLPLILVEDLEEIKHKYMPILKAFKKYLPIHSFYGIFLNLTHVKNEIAGEIIKGSTKENLILNNTPKDNVSKILFKFVIARLFEPFLIENRASILEFLFYNALTQHYNSNFEEIDSVTFNIKSDLAEYIPLKTAIFPSNITVLKNRNIGSIRYKTISEGNTFINIFEIIKKFIEINSQTTKNNDNKYILQLLNPTYAIFYAALSFSDEEIKNLIGKIDASLVPLIKDLELEASGEIIKDIRQNIDSLYKDLIQIIKYSNELIEILMKELELNNKFRKKNGKIRPKSENNNLKVKDFRGIIKKKLLNKIFILIKI